MIAVDTWACAVAGFAGVFLLLAFPGVLHALVHRPDERDTPDDIPTEGDQK